MGELFKYGGPGMVNLLKQLFSVIWQEEIVNIFKKGDRRILVTTGLSPYSVL